MKRRREWRMLPGLNNSQPNSEKLPSAEKHHPLSNPSIDFHSATHHPTSERLSQPTTDTYHMRHQAINDHCKRYTNGNKMNQLNTILAYHRILRAGCHWLPQMTSTHGCNTTYPAPWRPKPNSPAPITISSKPQNQTKIT